MSRNATELCLLLVDETYGNSISRVFEILMSFGRLTVPVMLSLSGLSPKELRHSLVVLVQQHLALWYSPTDEDTTYYEADWANAYALVRSGKLIKNVEDRFGEFAGGLASNLLLLGHAQVGDLAQAYNIEPSKSNPSLPNKTQLSTNTHSTDGPTKGHSKSSAHTSQLFHSSLYTLIQAGYVSTVNQSHFRSMTDNKYEAERYLQRNAVYQGALKGDKKVEYDNALEDKLCEWKFNIEVEAKIIDNLGKKLKRQLNGDESVVSDRSGKRMRLDADPHKWANGNSPYTEGSSAATLDNDLILRVNHDKFAVAARSKRLVELVEQRISKASSQVYKELLIRLEKDIRCCNPKSQPINDPDEEGDPEDNPGVSTMDLIDALRDTIDLTNSIGHVDPDSIDLDQLIHPKNRRRKIEASSEDEDIAEIDHVDHNGNLSGTREDHDQINGDTTHNRHAKVEKEGSFPASSSFTELLRQNLLLLAEHPYHFVHHTRPTLSKPETWTVDFPSLSTHLRLLELETIITARYGPHALRIVRILQQKGKLDEKALGTFGLMNQKLMRSILTTMHEAGHLELQEIPRDNHRQPSRTMFLWFFDPERCRRKVLEETYKAMARCLQRVKVEREAVQTVVDKAERSDVVGKEEEYLGAGERATLEEWREREERLLGEVGRLDDLVAVLRDF